MACSRDIPSCEVGEAVRLVGRGAAGGSLSEHDAAVVWRLAFFGEGKGSGTRGYYLLVVRRVGGARVGQGGGLWMRCDCELRM